MGKASRLKVQRREQEEGLVLPRQAQTLQRRWLAARRSSQQDIKRSDASARRQIEATLSSFDAIEILQGLADLYCGWARVSESDNNKQLARAGVATRAVKLAVDRYIDSASGSGPLPAPPPVRVGTFVDAVFNLAPPAAFTAPTGPEHMWQLLSPMMVAQFRFQMNPYRELARASAVMMDFKSNGMPSGKDWCDILKVDIDLFIAIGFALSTLAATQRGWLSKRDTILAVARLASTTNETAGQIITELFAADRLGLEAIRTKATVPNLKEAARPWAFCPLEARPLIDGARSDFWFCPVPRYCIGRVSMSGLYFDGLEHFDKDGNKSQLFTGPLGVSFEQYVGQVLHQFEKVGGSVIGEIVFDSNGSEAKSVDYFIVLKSCVLLVEAKAAKLVEQARVGELDGLESIRKRLNKAMDQISRSAKEVKCRHRDFKAVPFDKPLFGICVTADHFGLVQPSGLLNLLERSSVPSQVLHIGDLEFLCERLGGLGDASDSILTSFESDQTVTKIVDNITGTGLSCLSSWWDKLDARMKSL